ncbi:hypothetical protein GA0116948_1403 [Chitinophaga costaii]|uniref:Uncharacterized protein n=1 Tax=Chitinophaga costaii TaxID=1335309 RepID=A0A1C4GAS6_9BACT|nr:hypothetical protein [Chitinophaga costaii]SCC64925.1 hypothetical protein GA0116948_1403 [Chitinophaga costaii]
MSGNSFLRSALVILWLNFKRTGVTRHLLWKENRQQYPGGYGYSQFCDLLTRHSSIIDISMQFEYPPGQMMMGY